MWKWLNGAARLLATALLLSFLSVWTTGYIVNRYIETVLGQLGLPIQTQPPALSGFWGKMWGADPLPPAEESETKDTGGSGISPSGSPEPDRPQAGQRPEEDEDAAAGPTGGSLPESEAGTSAPDASAPEDVPVFGNGGSALGITEEQREALRSVMMQLNEEQLQQLTRILEDGLTRNELENAESLFENALNEKDYNILMKILRSRLSTQPEWPNSAQDQAF